MNKLRTIRRRKVGKKGKRTISKTGTIGGRERATRNKRITEEYINR